MRSIQILSSGLLLALAPAVFAATFSVTNLNENGPGSFQQAILDANASSVDPVDDIVFGTALSGTITPRLAISPIPIIADSVRIFGPSSGAVTIDLVNEQRFIMGSMVTEVEFHDLRIINGEAEEGGCMNNSNRTVLWLNRVTFSNCFATAADASGARGGALYTTGFTTISDAVFENNMASGGFSGPALGGAIMLGFSSGGSSLSISGSAFTGNIAIADSDTPGVYTNGGAIFQEAGELDVTGSWFGLNQAIESGSGSRTASGGAIYFNSDAVRIGSTIFSRNIVEGSGSALFVFHGNSGVNGSTELQNNLFVDNYGNQGGAQNNGAAVAIGRSELAMRNNTFFGNHSSNGGSSLFHSIDLDNLAISGNAFAASADGSPSCTITGAATPDSNFNGNFNFFSDASCSWLAAAGTQHAALGLHLVGVTTSSTTTPKVLPLSTSVVLDAAGFATSTMDFSVCPSVDLEGNSRPLDNDGDSDAHCTAGAIEAALLFADGMEP